MEQKKADENVLRLVQEQRREKEEALNDILRLERELNEKQKLEMEIQELKGSLQVMKHLGNKDYEALQSKMKELEELEKKEDQEARKKLIKMDSSSAEESEISDSENDVRNSSLQLASMEQKKADENVLRLVQEQQREMQEALKDIMRLERELDEKQKLEMEIQELKGTLQVMKHLGNEDDEALQSKMKELEEKLEEKEDQEACKKLIKVDGMIH